MAKVSVDKMIAKHGKLDFHDGYLFCSCKLAQDIRGRMRRERPIKQGPLKLKASVLTYEVSDPSGYKFEVEAKLDPERGWGATVILRSSGMRTAQAAVETLRTPIEHLLRQLAEAKEKQDFKEIEVPDAESAYERFVREHGI